jgi:hypothetical protein
VTEVRKRTGQQRDVEFTITDGETTYSYISTVYGERLFTQTIRVIGIGSKNDSAEYGPGAHCIESMEGVASMIAGEIVSAHHAMRQR